MLSFNPHCWSALHIPWAPTFGVFMPHYSPQLVERWTCVSSPLLSHTPHRIRTCGSRGATQRGVRFDLGGISQLTFWRQGWILVRSIFIIYFVRLPLCNKYSDYILTFISIHYVIIYVAFFGACMRCIRLCPLKPGVTEVVSEEMLIVWQNLDRKGQNPYLLTLLWFFLYLYWSCLTFYYSTLINLTFATLILS
jgi:uncharacterized membrane protein YccF (DUF307 family)